MYGPVDARHYARKYDTAYTGIVYAGFIAYDQLDGPVAYYGVIPCFIRQGRETVLAAQSADTMTHPAHRGKGLFVELSHKTFGLCRSLGIRLLFGFPNEHSYHGAVNKLGWQPVHTMSCFTVRVNSFPLATACFRRRFLKKLYHAYAAWVLRAYRPGGTPPANSVLNDGFAGLFRTEGYELYKQNCSSSRLIGMGRAEIRVSVRQALLVGDMAGVDAGNFAAVMKGLERLARKLGIREVQFHGSPGTSLHELFAGAYAGTPSYPVLYQDFGTSISPERLRFHFADLDIF